jgi:hypothetical protein
MRLAAIAIVLAAALVGLGAPGVAAAKACPNEKIAVFGKPTTFRFVLRRVSCKKGRSLIRAYFRKATFRSCRDRGMICGFDFPGHWTCSLPAYVGEGGGYTAACFNTRTRAQVKAFTVHHRH